MALPAPSGDPTVGTTGSPQNAERINLEKGMRLIRDIISSLKSKRVLVSGQIKIMEEVLLARACDWTELMTPFDFYHRRIYDMHGHAKANNNDVVIECTQKTIDDMDRLIVFVSNLASQLPDQLFEIQKEEKTVNLSSAANELTEYFKYYIHELKEVEACFSGDVPPPVYIKRKRLVQEGDDDPASKRLKESTLQKARGGM